MQNKPMITDQRYIGTNRWWFSRYIRPEWEERFSVINTNAPNPTEKPKFRLTTISTWFVCPVGRPLSTGATYTATDRKVFIGGRIPVTCYKINGAWYNEELFSVIVEL